MRSKESHIGISFFRSQVGAGKRPSLAVKDISCRTCAEGWKKTSVAWFMHAASHPIGIGVVVTTLSSFLAYFDRPHMEIRHWSNLNCGQSEPHVRALSSGLGQEAPPVSIFVARSACSICAYTRFRQGLERSRRCHREARTILTA